MPKLTAQHPVRRLVGTLATLFALFSCTAGMHSGSRSRWESHDLFDGVRASATAPKGKLVARFDGTHLEVKARRDTGIRLAVTPPASFVWSADGTAVAVNNGNGSGQTSELSLILYRRGSLQLFDGVQGDLRSYFRLRTGCRADQHLISVQAQGWMPSGLALWVTVENWDRTTPCNDSGFDWALYDIDRRIVLEVVPAHVMMRRYCSDPVFHRRFGPNCSRHVGAVTWPFHKGEAASTMVRDLSE
jgi:hypothetical protein